MSRMIEGRIGDQGIVFRGLGLGRTWPRFHPRLVEIDRDRRLAELRSVAPGR